MIMRRTYLILALSLASITALLLVASVLAGGVPSTPVYGYGYWKKPPLHSAATLVGARDAGYSHKPVHRRVMRLSEGIAQCEV